MQFGIACQGWGASAGRGFPGWGVVGHLLLLPPPKLVSLSLGKPWQAEQLTLQEAWGPLEPLAALAAFSCVVQSPCTLGSTNARDGQRKGRGHSALILVDNSRWA